MIPKTPKTPAEPAAPPETDKPRGWFNGFLNRLTGWLGGKEYHYAGYLPSRPGLLLRYTLDPFFNRVDGAAPSSSTVSRNWPSKGAVVYALKYRSHLDFLFFNRRYQKLGVRCPRWPSISTCGCGSPSPT